MLAALASKVTDRPVKLALTRQQVFHSTFHRSDTIQRIRLGATPDGRLVSVAHQSWSGNTPGEENFEASAEVTRSLYATPNIMTEHRLAALDVPVASAMRAPGEAVGMLAIECAMDELAEKLSAWTRSSCAALNNATEDPTKHVPYSTRAMVPCLRKGAELFGWDRGGTRRRALCGTATGSSASASRRRAAATPCSPPRPGSASARTASPRPAPP